MRISTLSKKNQNALKKAKNQVTKKKNKSKNENKLNANLASLSPVSIPMESNVENTPSTTPSTPTLGPSAIPLQVNTKKLAKEAKRRKAMENLQKIKNQEKKTFEETKRMMAEKTKNMSNENVNKQISNLFKNNTLPTQTSDLSPEALAKEAKRQKAIMNLQKIKNQEKKTFENTKRMMAEKTKNMSNANVNKQIFNLFKNNTPSEETTLEQTKNLPENVRVAVNELETAPVGSKRFNLIFQKLQEVKDNLNAMNATLKRRGVVRSSSSNSIAAVAAPSTSTAPLKLEKQEGMIEKQFRTKFFNKLPWTRKNKNKSATPSVGTNPNKNVTNTNANPSGSPPVPVKPKGFFGRLFGKKSRTRKNRSRKNRKTRKNN